MQAKEVAHAAVGNTWASEFDSQQEAQDHEDVWRQFNGVRMCACMPRCLSASSVTYFKSSDDGALYTASMRCSDNKSNTVSNKDGNIVG